MCEGPGPGGIVGGARVHGVLLRWWGPFSVWREARWAEPAGRRAASVVKAGAGALLALEPRSVSLGWVCFGG